MTLLRLYKKNNDEVVRLIEDLEYYMLETKDKDKYLYFVAANKFDMYIIWDRNTTWDHEKVSLIISNCLKKSTFMHVYMNGYNGVMNENFWKDLRTCTEYFSNVKKFRKELKKIEQSEELIIPENNEITIDDVLNKINESGLESLTDEEKEILKNNQDE